MDMASPSGGEDYGFDSRRGYREHLGRFANIPSPLDERWDFSIIRTIIDRIANNMVEVAQLDRASDCGSECREFESPLPPFFIS